MSNITEKDKKDPSNPTSNYVTMQGRWFMISSLLGGTESMREAGENLLPRHAREGDENYNERLQKAVLFNMFELTVNLLADKPFTEQIGLGDTIPETIKQYAEDIDFRGNNLNRFAYEVFRQGLAKGFTHVYVDAPRSAAAPGEVRTLADDRDEGMRPYVVHLRPEAVYAAETTRINGEDVFTHVRFSEIEKGRDGFAEVFQEYVRVLDLLEDIDGSLFVRSEKWRKTDKRDRSNDEWVVVETVNIPVDRIPFASYYTNYEGELLSKPPLIDLAFMNTEHWQSYSDQQNILTVSRFPLLAASGISEYDGGDTVVGPRNMLIAEDPQSRYYYVEHTGAAIEVGFKSLADLEAKMASYGGSLLQKRPDRETAAARDAAEQNVTAPLQRMVAGFQDFWAEVFILMSMLDGNTIETDVAQLAEDIRIKNDFGDDAATAVDLQTLQVAVREGAISRRGFLTQLKRLGLVGEEFDIEQELKNIRDEAELVALLAAASKGIIGTMNAEDVNNGPANTDTPTEDEETEEED